MRAIKASLIFVALLAASASAKPLVLHPDWRAVAVNVAVAGTSEYTFAATSYTAGVVINERTSEQRPVVTPPDCRFDGTMGGLWLTALCPSLTIGFYNLISGQWFTAVRFDAACRNQPCRLSAVGTYWLKYDVAQRDCIEHCGSATWLQNVATGETKPDPVTPGGRVFDDLSSPNGAVPLCGPLRYPTTPTLAGPVPGELAFYGQYAVTLGAEGQRLRRCHTSFSKPLPPQQVLGNSKVLLWTEQSGLLVGQTLPRSFTRQHSGRNLVISEPPGQGLVLTAVSQTTIYMLSRTAPIQLWAASIPKAISG